MGSDEARRQSNEINRFFFPQMGNRHTRVTHVIEMINDYIIVCNSSAHTPSTQRVKMKVVRWSWTGEGDECVCVSIREMK